MKCRSISLAVFALEIWMIIESIIVLKQIYGPERSLKGFLVEQEIIIEKMD